MADIDSPSGKFKAFDSRFMGKPLQKNPEQKLRDVSDMYEKHFLREMMKAMRSTVHEGGFVQSNQAEKIFREQLDEHYVEKWGERGGIGLSDLIYKQLVDKFGSQMGIRKSDNANSANNGNGGLAIGVGNNSSGGSNKIKNENVNSDGIDRNRFKAMDVPKGPLSFDNSNSTSKNPNSEKIDDRKISFRASPFQHPGKKDSVSYRFDVLKKNNSEEKTNVPVNDLQKNDELKNADLNERAVKVPWDGVLIGKKVLADNQIMVELEHDNGLKSQLVFKGNLSKDETLKENNGKLQAGDTLGFLGVDAKAVYWTVEKNSAAAAESGPDTVSE
ncbi:MAG: rod-binding protein [Bdellovibrio sp.]